METKLIIALVLWIVGWAGTLREIMRGDDNGLNWWAPVVLLVAWPVMAVLLAACVVLDLILRHGPKK